MVVGWVTPIGYWVGFQADLGVKQGFTIVNGNILG